MFETLSNRDLTDLHHALCTTLEDLEPLVESGKLDPSPWLHVVEVLYDQSLASGFEMERRGILDERRQWARAASA